jgi:hypothetical protein
VITCPNNIGSPQGNDFVASYNALVDLFERLGNSLRPLEIYIGIPLTDEVTGPLGGIMGQVLSILALWTRIRMSSGKGASACRVNVVLGLMQ